MFLLGSHTPNGEKHAFSTMGELKWPFSQNKWSKDVRVIRILQIEEERQLQSEKHALCMCSTVSLSVVTP